MFICLFCLNVCRASSKAKYKDIFGNSLLPSLQFELPASRFLDDPVLLSPQKHRFCLDDFVSISIRSHLKTRIMSYSPVWLSFLGKCFYVPLKRDESPCSTLWYWRLRHRLFSQWHNHKHNHPHRKPKSITSKDTVSTPQRASDSLSLSKASVSLPSNQNVHPFLTMYRQSQEDGFGAHAEWETRVGATQKCMTSQKSDLRQKQQMVHHLPVTLRSVSCLQRISGNCLFMHPEKCTKRRSGWLRNSLRKYILWPVASQSHHLLRDFTRTWLTGNEIIC